jgi:hypothetical protein
MRGLSENRHCANVAAQAMARVSPNPSSTMPRRINKKFTDIVPAMPGSFTFSREAMTAIAR